MYILADNILYGHTALFSDREILVLDISTGYTAS